MPHLKPDPRNCLDLDTFVVHRICVACTLSSESCCNKIITFKESTCPGHLHAQAIWENRSKGGVLYLAVVEPRKHTPC